MQEPDQKPRLMARVRAGLIECVPVIPVIPTFAVVVWTVWTLMTGHSVVEFLADWYTASGVPAPLAPLETLVPAIALFATTLKYLKGRQPPILATSLITLTTGIAVFIPIWMHPITGLFISSATHL
jgi:hypothetical protein